MMYEQANFNGMVGVWGGTGEAETGMPVAVRVAIEHAQEGAALRLHLEACDPQFQSLYHGLRAVFPAQVEAGSRGAAFSTIHKQFLFDLAPDDGGSLRLTGVTGAGNRLFVQLRPEGGDSICFSACWRAPGQEPEGPRMTAHLKRLRPLQFASPPGALPTRA